MSSTKGIGRLSPCMLPSRPTAFLRIAQMRSTSSWPRATVKPRRPLTVPSAASASVIRLSGASTASSEWPTNSTRLTPVAGRPSSSGKEVAHVLPDDVVLGERQHLGIDGLDRGGPEPDESLGVTQRRVEAVVADVDQRAVARDRQHVELGFGQEAERALRAAQDRVEVEAALRVADMGEVVAREAAVELGEVLVDQVRLVAGDVRESRRWIAADPVGAALDRSQLRVGKGRSSARPCRRGARW